MFCTLKRVIILLFIFYSPNHIACACQVAVLIFVIKFVDDHHTRLWLYEFCKNCCRCTCTRFCFVYFIVICFAVLQQQQQRQRQRRDAVDDTEAEQGSQAASFTHIIVSLEPRQAIQLVLRYVAVTLQQWQIHSNRSLLCLGTSQPPGPQFVKFTNMPGMQNWINVGYSISKTVQLELGAPIWFPYCGRRCHLNPSPWVPALRVSPGRLSPLVPLLSSVIQSQN